MQEHWQPSERKAARLTLVAPLLVSLVTVFALTPAMSTDVLFATPLIALWAYVSLLLFVLPTLKMLQRVASLGRASFSATVAASGTIPWFVFYMALFASPNSAKYGGAPGYVMLLLAVPLAATFLVSYFIHPHIMLNEPSSKTL